MKNKVLLDCRINETSVNTLELLGFKPIYIPVCNCLQKPVSAHPDMSVFVIDDKIFTVKELVHLFYGGEVVFCEREEKLHLYPDDVMLNCAVVGNKALCREDFLHPKIKKYLIDNNYDILNVKQGYAKCSICVVNDNAIITEDDSIEKTAKEACIDVLKLQKGHVKLYGYDYGFIGGASGLLNENLLCFNGCIENHPQYLLIKEFCRKYDVDLISLNDDVLYDVGSIMVI